jgi:hypothetical protein
VKCGREKIEWKIRNEIIISIRFSHTHPLLIHVIVFCDVNIITSENEKRDLIFILLYYYYLKRNEEEEK